jgi:hypothetical protein
MTVSATADGTPDSGSLAVQPTGTSPLYHPAPLGAVFGAPERIGAVVSPAATVTEVREVFPAASVAVPLTVVPGWTIFESEVVPSA